MKHILIVLCMLIACTTSNAQSDIEKVRSRLFELAQNKQHRSEMNTKTPLDSIVIRFNEETGTWSDLNYEDPTRSGWEPSEHWMRIYELAVALNTSHLGNSTFGRIVTRAVDFWVTEPPLCTNWWWNEIGIPLFMGKTLVLCNAQIIPPDDRAKLTEMMSQGLNKGAGFYGNRTGQNLMWLATVHIFIGVEQSELNALHRAFDAIKAEIELTTEEGIQHDFSFHQHGAQLYNFGYGRTFGLYMAQLAHLASDTQFEFPSEKIAIISNYLLQGQQWMMYKDRMDFNAMGRVFTRPHIDSEPILWSAQMMQKADPTRGEEYEVFMDDYYSASNSIAFTGNKHFWQSDIMVHRQPNYYSTIKMSSYRVKWTEVVNQENIRGYYMGNGIQCIMRRGDEYDKVYPLWDWKKLPGLLCEQDEMAYPDLNEGAGADNTTVFVGGVSNGTQGLAVNDYEKHGMQAKRAWFFFDNEIVHLISGIDYEGENTLFQSVNQCNAFGDAFYEDNGKPKKLKSGIPMQTSWVWHDSISYYFLGDYSIQASSETRKGNWKDINAAYDIPIEGDVFSLGIEIPSFVQRSDSFAYIIKPNVSLGEAPGAKNNITVIANNKTQQAVFNKSLNQYQMVFHQPGRLVLSEEIWMEMDSPGLMIATFSEQGNVQISVANPLNRKWIYHIQTNLPLAGKDCTYNENDKVSKLTFKTASPPYAGKSVSGTYTSVN